MTPKRDEFREEMKDLVCINSGDIIPDCGGCIYFNSVTEYPCNNPKLNLIIEAHKAVIREIRAELEKTLTDVHSYLGHIKGYKITVEEWQEFWQKFGGE